MITEIPKSEFQDRVVRVQAGLAKRGLDALLTFGNESEPAFVRYLCDYWPAFETAGVLVPVEGDRLSWAICRKRKASYYRWDWMPPTRP